MSHLELDLSVPLIVKCDDAIGLDELPRICELNATGLKK